MTAPSRGVKERERGSEKHEATKTKENLAWNRVSSIEERVRSACRRKELGIELSSVHEKVSKGTYRDSK